MPKVNKKRLSAGASLRFNEFLPNFQDLFYQYAASFKHIRNGLESFCKKSKFSFGQSDKRYMLKMVLSDTFIDPLIDPKEIKHIKSVIKSGQSFIKST